jgi:hypothetical protein
MAHSILSTTCFQTHRYLLFLHLFLSLHSPAQGSAFFMQRNLQGKEHETSHHEENPFYLTAPAFSRPQSCHQLRCNLGNEIRKLSSMSWSREQPCRGAENRSRLRSRLHICSVEGVPPSGASDRKTAVIIVDHGSRRPESNEQLEEFVQLYM